MGQNFATNAWQLFGMMRCLIFWRRLLTVFVASTLIVVTSGMVLSASSTLDFHLSLKSFGVSNFQGEVKTSQNLKSSAAHSIDLGADLVTVNVGNDSDNFGKTLCAGKCCFALASLSFVKNEKETRIFCNINWPVTVEFLRPFTSHGFDRPPRTSFAILLRA